MKKIVKTDPRAKREFDEFNESAQNKFDAFKEILGQDGFLTKHYAQKLDKNLYEIRVKEDKKIYRGFYAYLVGDYIIIVHYFQKKSQKTPKKNIILARRRIKEYE